MADLFDYRKLATAPKFGTEPDKLVRRNDPCTSVDAACSVNSEKWEEKVYDAISKFGNDGCTSDELRATYFPDVPYSTVTGRYKALMEGALIIDTGMRRAGLSGRKQRVMRAAIHGGNDESIGQGTPL